MSQVTEFIIGSSPLNMSQLKTELDNYFAAMGSQNKGSAAPSNPFDGMYWIDDSATPWLIKIYDTTNGWTTSASLDATTGIFTPYYDGAPVNDSRVTVATITPGSDADVTLSAAQNQAGVRVLETGSWAAGHSLIGDDADREFTVINNSGFTATGTTSGTTPTTVDIRPDGVPYALQSRSGVGVEKINGAEFAANVKDYGAVGDGVTDDTSAVQAAFDSGVTEIYFPGASSKYAVDTITIPSTTKKVFGPGVIYQRTQDNDIFSITSSTGCVFEGLNFEGIWSTGLSAAGLSTNRAILATSCSNIVISSCYFTRIRLQPVHLIDCDNCSVENNRMFECGYGVYIRGSRDIGIRGNIVDTTIYDDTVFCIGVSLESTDGHAFGISERVTIDGNIVKGFKNAQGVMAHAGTDLTISNNVVNDPVIGISINPFNATDTCSSISIAGNAVSCVTTLAGYSGGNDGIILQAGGSTPDITDASISGNVVRNGNRAEDAANQGGIRIGFTRRVSITGNVIEASGRNGIVLADVEEGVVITGNMISSTIVGGSTQNGILIQGNAEGYISGNQIQDMLDASAAGVYFTATSAIRLGGNYYYNVTANVVNGQHEADRDSKTITSGTTVDLSGVSIIYFQHGSATTVSTFTGVVPGKLYTFIFLNGNTTIDRTSAYLDGGTNKTGSTNDVMMMVGRTSTFLRQAAPISANS